MTQAKTQFITLYGRQYKVKCPPGEEAVLKQTEDMLNQRIMETKQKSGLTTREDIIMMAALNLCHEAVERQHQDQKEAEALAASQAADMVRNQNNTQATAQRKTRSPESGIAQAASKASQILKEKRT